MVKILTIYRVLEPFLVKPNEKLHLAGISRELKQPHPTARQWLNNLEKKGVLKKEHQGRLTLYLLNLQNPNIIDYLAIAEKNKLINLCEKNPILAELVNYIHLNYRENALIFGSASESFSNAQDIDLLLTGNMDTKPLKTFAKRLNKELHIINVRRLNKISNALRKEISKKHLLINGSEELVRWLIWQQ